MRGFLIRFGLNVLGLWLAAELVRGISFDDTRTFLVAALVLGFVNAIIRPVLVMLTFPITIFTLGIFLLVINAAMFGLVAYFVAYFVDGFDVANFRSAAFGTLIVGITGWFGSGLVGPRGRVERMVVSSQR